MSKQQFRILSILVCASALAATAQQEAAPPDLRYAIVVTRHGVRAPSWTPAQLNQYSAQPWPKWDVQPSELTPHGYLLMRQFGAYYRAYFGAQGLLPTEGCAHTASLGIWADTDQRTLETGRALAEGLAPGCGLKTGSESKDAQDPLFNPFGMTPGKPDRELALGAVLGRIAGNPAALLQAHAPAFAEMQHILSGAGRPRLSLDEPITVKAGKGDNVVDVTGALRTASTLTENLLLVYTDGRTGSDLGWGRLNADNLQQVLTLHTAYADLARRTPYLASIRGSNLLFHIAASLQQAADAKPVQGALGSAHARVLFLVGHDTNLSNLSGLLRLNWVLPGYAPDDTPPGGALVFELRRRGNEPARVRVFYTVQSLDQMHAAQPLTLQSPPLRAPLFLPGCSTAGEGYECSWTAFRRLAEAAIDPQFVVR
ncbi:histidine-type phosphatase [Paludibaculum fermentans]|uniref:Histidine-type phosphatase n=1 Tax=Paludibaculum fermentans TaxID=1473598 RepID=A0A7S7NVA9_PALFE|nr:histidine-type phosphatase [Paludibaculum fermentans]QOY90386.1 histidine-type phosphatase [Paludibaculum fermentans]